MLDRFDREILARLQQDATVSMAALAQAVHLGASAVWRRIQKLEDSGVIRQRVVLLEGARLNLGVTCFVSVRTGHHGLPWTEAFRAAIERIEEVVEVYRLSGDTDYLLRVVASDIAAYDAVYRRIVELPGLLGVRSHFAMETIKYSTALPLRYAD